MFIKGTEQTQTECTVGQFHTIFLSIFQWVNLTVGEQVTPIMKKSNGNEITIVFHVFLYNMLCAYTESVTLSFEK